VCKTLFFGGVRGLNPGPCIYYALSLPTELSSRGQVCKTLYTNELKLNCELLTRIDFLPMFHQINCKNAFHAFQTIYFKGQRDTDHFRLITYNFLLIYYTRRSMPTTVTEEFNFDVGKESKWKYGRL